MLLGTYASDAFTVTDNRFNSTVALPCFAAGTRIRTRRGDVNVGHLRVGDKVAALRGCRLHVEVEAHDVVLAKGLPAESYLDTGDRTHFANGGVVATLYSSFASLTREASGCARLVVTGPIMAKLRRRLRRHALRRRTDRLTA
jgi:hypothetical protein